MNLSYAVVEQNLVVVDDLIQLFRKSASCRCIGWHTNMEDAFRDISIARPGLTLLNMELLKNDFAECAARLKHVLPSSQIIVLVGSEINKGRKVQNYWMKLSPRETKVMELLVEGLRYSEIAQNLGVAYATISTHIRHIYKKLHVNSRAKAVAKYLGNNIPAEASRIATPVSFTGNGSRKS